MGGENLQAVKSFCSAKKIDRRREAHFVLLSSPRNLLSMSGEEETYGFIKPVHPSQAFHRMREKGWACRPKL